MMKGVKNVTFPFSNENSDKRDNFLTLLLTNYLTLFHTNISIYIHTLHTIISSLVLSLFSMAT